MKRILILGLALGLAPLAPAAEPATFEQLLAGKEYPLSLKFKDLDGNWRRFSANAGADAANVVRAMYGAAAGGGNLFYTKGQTVSVGGETYLVAYRVQTKAMDMAGIQVAMQAAMMRGGQPPEPEKPTAMTSLALTLLNLRSTGSLADIRAFNLEAEITGTEAPSGEEDKHAQEVNDATIKNLRQIGTALLTYVGERKVLPVLTDAKAAQNELVLYLRSKDVFNQPGTQKPYQPNAALSGKKPSEFEKPDRVAVFYEPAASADGLRACLFLDGHAERVAEQQWKKIKELSQIP